MRMVTAKAFANAFNGIKNGRYTEEDVFEMLGITRNMWTLWLNKFVEAEGDLKKCDFVEPNSIDRFYNPYKYTEAELLADEKNYIPSKAKKTEVVLDVKATKVKKAELPKVKGIRKWQTTEKLPKPPKTTKPTLIRLELMKK